MVFKISTKGLQKGFITQPGAGSPTTFYTDYSFLNKSGHPVFGGHRTDGVQAGTFSLKIGSDASHVAVSASGRLLFF